MKLSMQIKQATENANGANVNRADKIQTADIDKADKAQIADKPQKT